MTPGRTKPTWSEVVALTNRWTLLLFFLFAYKYSVHGFDLVFVQQGLFLIAMVAILAVNLRTSLIPNVITLPGIPLGIGFSLFAPPGWMSSLLGLSSGAAVFVISELYRRSSGKEGIGMGCVKQMAMIGAFLGWQQAVVAFVLGSWVGTFIALIHGARSRPQTALPFGAALSCGAIIASTVGDRIVAPDVSRANRRPGVPSPSVQSSYDAFASAGQFLRRKARHKSASWRALRGRRAVAQWRTQLEANRIARLLAVQRCQPLRETA